MIFEFLQKLLKRIVNHIYFGIGPPSTTKVTVTRWTDDKVCTSGHAGKFGFFMMHKTSHEGSYQNYWMQKCVCAVPY